MVQGPEVSKKAQYSRLVDILLRSDNLKLAQTVVTELGELGNDITELEDKISAFQNSQ